MKISNCEGEKCFTTILELEERYEVKFMLQNRSSVIKGRSHSCERIQGEKRIIPAWLEARIASAPITASTVVLPNKNVSFYLEE